MNICLVSQEYPPETGWGGIGTYIRELAQGLSDLGHNVFVISKWVENCQEEYFDGQVKIYRIKSKEFPFSFLIRRYWRANRQLGYGLKILERSYSVKKKLDQLLKSYPIDIVEFPEWGAEGFFFSYKARIPFVVRLHTPFKIVEKLNKRKKDLNSILINYLEKKTTSRTKWITTSSKSLANEVSPLFGLSKSHIRIIPYLIDVHHFIPSSDSMERKTLKVLYTGRLERRKGIETLFKAIPKILSRVSNVQFLFVGADVPIENSNTLLGHYLLNKCDKNVANSIVLEGKVNHSKLVKYYQQSDVFVIPSLYEAFGITCIEALSCGLPVVGSNVGGIAEIVSNMEGILVEPANSDQLADGILNLLVNKNLRRELGENSRKKAEERYSREIISKKMLDFYKYCILNQNE